MNAYSRREVARIFHISPSRLRYWERTRLVRASAEADSGAAFDFLDLRSIQHVLGLLERGMPLRRIRRSLSDVARRLPELTEPLPALQVWAEGSPRMVVEHAGGLFEPGGQMVLDFRAPGPEEPRVAALPAAGSPLDAAEWFERGCTLDAEAATWGEAIESYQRALELDPEYADAHCNLGTVFYNQGRRSAATEAFRRALELEPLHLEANFNLANLLEEEGDAEAALERYQNVLRIDPLYADAHVNLALLFEKIGSLRRGRDHWRRYLQVDPEGAWADVARRHLSASPPPDPGLG